MRYAKQQPSNACDWIQINAPLYNNTQPARPRKLDWSLRCREFQHFVPNVFQLHQLHLQLGNVI